MGILLGSGMEFYGKLLLGITLDEVFSKITSLNSKCHFQWSMCRTLSRRLGESIMIV